MCFQEAIDMFRGKGQEDGATKQLKEEKASMEANRRREEKMRNDESMKARRDAISESQRDATLTVNPEEDMMKKKKLKGLSSLRVNKAGVNTASVSPIGSGLVV